MKTWINPHETVRRFSLHQIFQHWAVTAVGSTLLLTAILSPFANSGWPSRYHVFAGMAGAAFFLYHLFSLVAIGIRDDVPAGKVAFLPTAASSMTKYNPAERGDYLNILLWSALLVASGIFLRWPGRLGIPGPGSYYWLRVIHAGCGTAWTIHLLSAHIPDRWLRSSGPFRRAILTGTVPLGEAEKRTDWIADLVSAGMLVPAPEETPQEDRQESGQVRDLLELGNRLTREERYEEAVNAFEEALALYPQYSQARFNLGVARMRMGHMEQAREQFRLFIEADPFNPIAGRAREMLEEIVGKKNEDDR